jgi:hypothetical protein
VLLLVLLLLQVILWPFLLTMLMRNTQGLLLWWRAIFSGTASDSSGFAIGRVHVWDPYAHWIQVIKFKRLFWVLLCFVCHTCACYWPFTLESWTSKMRLAYCATFSTCMLIDSRFMSSDVPAAVKDTWCDWWSRLDINLCEMISQAKMTDMLETTNILFCYTGVVSIHMIIMMLWRFL